VLKRLLLLAFLALFVTLSVGCGGAKTARTSGGHGEMSVLSSPGDMSGLTSDQIAELRRVVTWMDRDIIKQLNRAGYRAVLLKSRHDFKGPGHLLMMDVGRFSPGNRAARAFVGFGAGASSLDMHYKLLNSQGKTVSAWDDGTGSSKGGTYCAQTLNRNTVKQLNNVLK